jgi:putative membrane protein insertion efficiency factor
VKRGVPFILPRSIARSATRAARSAGLAALTGLFRLYRLVLSPLLGPSCRFEPSCSRYAEEAIETHGLLEGIRLALFRICRCHPFALAGLDPVPAPRSTSSTSRRR